MDKITKIYGNRFSSLRIRALNEFSLSLKGGEIVCIKGSNGSGKSTVLRIITGLVRPTTGSLYIEFDMKSTKLSPRIGYCPDNPSIYRNVTVIAFLKLISNILGVSSVIPTLIQNLQDFNLLKWIEEPIGTLSKGMLHKVSLIASMLDNPQLLVLDEPFSSLDEQSANALIDKLHSLSSKGSTIIFADPSSERLEKIVDMIMDLNTMKVIS